MGQILPDEIVVMALSRIWPAQGKSNGAHDPDLVADRPREDRRGECRFG
jgi:hypothetical protein